MAIITSKHTELKLRSITSRGNELILSFEKLHYYPSEDHIVRVELSPTDTRLLISLLGEMDKLSMELENEAE